MPTRSTPILLVIHDDNQLLRQIAKMTSEVVELLPSRRAGHANAILQSAERIDVVIVGRIGDGATAIDLLGAIRARRPQARTVLLSDPTDLATPIEALHAGLVDHVINPPLRERELRAIIALPAPRPLINLNAIASMSAQPKGSA